MCVRLDRRAVYLGHPSPNQHCPAGLIGAAGDRRRSRRRELGRERVPLGAGPDRASGLRRRQRLHRARLRRLQRAVPRGDRGTWRASSPYRAVGVLHRRHQPRLLAAQPDRELGRRPDRAGWHLIPIYVGRQAPSSDCGKLRPSSARRRRPPRARPPQPTPSPRPGAVAMGTGSPILLRHESYSRSSSASAATPRLPPG